MEKKRVIAYMRPRKVGVHSLDFPNLSGRGTRKCDYGAILRIVTMKIRGATSISIRDEP